MTLLWLTPSKGSINGDARMSLWLTTNILVDCQAMNEWMNGFVMAESVASARTKINHASRKTLYDSLIYSVECPPFSVIDFCDYILRSLWCVKWNEMKWNETRSRVMKTDKAGILWLACVFLEISFDFTWKLQKEGVISRWISHSQTLAIVQSQAQSSNQVSDGILLSSIVMQVGCSSVVVWYRTTYPAFLFTRER
jgi:hypothetical protein